MNAHCTCGGVLVLQLHILGLQILILRVQLGALILRGLQVLCLLLSILQCFQAPSLTPLRASSGALQGVYLTGGASTSYRHC